MTQVQVGPVKVDPGRLAELVARVGEVGAQPGGGIIRHQYSPSWLRAQDLVAELMTQAGLRVRRDAVGNVFGRLIGEDDSRTVLTGSHIDTVVHGGAYDGALGVLSAIVAVEELSRQVGVPRRSVEVVSLCEEEGGRFHANYFGTRGILGTLDPGEPDRLVDSDGVTLAEAARSVGLDPDRFQDAARDDIDCFLELHIEQGRTLVDTGTQVGIVDVIVGLTWLEVVVTGRVDHAGATAMTDRLDALQGAAEMVSSVDARVRAAGAPAVATVGELVVRPGATNIVPGAVSFSVDVRHPDEEVLGALVAEFRQGFGRIAADRQLEVRVEVVKQIPPHQLDSSLREVLRAAAADAGVSALDLPSGAGHDSQTMGKHLPAAMLFVPSVDGRSHSPAELSTVDDCGRGASVLAAALRRVAW